MTEIWTQAALWLGLALVATLLAIGLRVATALSEIVVGTIAQLLIGATFAGALMAADASWLVLVHWRHENRAIQGLRLNFKLTREPDPRAT